MNEIILNYIAVIIGVAFLSAVIIGTAPPVMQDVDNAPPDLHHNASAQNSTIGTGYNSTIATSPLVFGALFTYGNHDLDMNANSYTKENAGQDVLLSVHAGSKADASQLPGDTEPANTSSEPEIEYDDDLFIETVGEKGEKISVIAIQCAEAVQCANVQVLTRHAAELFDISQKTWTEVEAMDISPTLMQDKRDFQHVMVQMITAASSFKRGLPESDRELQEMVGAISSAHKMLDTVRSTIGKKDFQQSGSHPAQGLYRVRVDTASEQEYARSQLSQYELFPKPVGLLPIRSGYHYMDASQSNDIRIVPRYSRVVSQYYYIHPDTGKTVHVYAPEGKIYIMVHIRVAHAGNRDGRRYTIQTPALSAFTLHGHGLTFSPENIPVVHTSLGEMYRQNSLYRNELYEGSIFFEVPFTMKPSDAYLSINLGNVWGKPGWELV